MWERTLLSDILSCPTTFVAQSVLDAFDYLLLALGSGSLRGPVPGS